MIETSTSSGVEAARVRTLSGGNLNFICPQRFDGDQPGTMKRIFIKDYQKITFKSPLIPLKL